MATIVDMDAFDPIPQRKIKVDGVEHAAFSILDVPYDCYMQAVRLDEHINAISDPTKQMDFIADIIQAFVPSLPREALFGGKGKRGLSLRKMGQMIGMLCAPDVDEGPDPLAPTPDA